MKIQPANLKKMIGRIFQESMILWKKTNKAQIHGQKSKK